MRNDAWLNLAVAWPFRRGRAAAPLQLRDPFAKLAALYP